MKPGPRIVHEKSPGPRPKDGIWEPSWIAFRGEDGVWHEYPAWSRVDDVELARRKAEGKLS